jgi:3-oxoacyl-[acyl-carrier protein] reductase
MGLLDKQVAVVTGAARGIGRSIAEALAAEGAAIAVFDVMDSGAETVAAIAAQFGVKTRFDKVDVTRAESVDAAVAGALVWGGRIDVLVNNAGVTRDNLMIRMTPEDWDLVLGINLKGSFLCTKSVFAQAMKNQRSGSIVNIASVVGVVGNAGQANYSASKGGLIALTKTTAKEFSKRNVRCNAVAPGFIQTEMTAKLSEEARKAWLANIPLARAGTPQDVADVVVFLAGPKSSYVTGQVVCIDGGMVM